VQLGGTHGGWIGHVDGPDAGGGADVDALGVVDGRCGKPVALEHHHEVVGDVEPVILPVVVRT